MEEACPEKSTEEKLKDSETGEVKSSKIKRVEQNLERGGKGICKGFRCGGGDDESMSMLNWA